MTFRSILIVDDEENQRFLVAQALRTLACDWLIATAASGHEALEAIGEHTPDLIITDYNMPDIDGFELTRRIRGTVGSHQLRIIGVSSSTDRLLSARFLKAGGNDFIMRPFIDEEFYCRVNQNLDTLTQIRTARQRQQA